MKYCKHCMLLTENDSCSQCGCRTSFPTDNDWCFLEEFPFSACRSMEELLTQNKIPFVFAEKRKGLKGAVTSKRIFVPYSQLVEAHAVLDALHGGREQNIIGQVVTVTMDRPLGSTHPRHNNIVYPVNYGYVENMLGGDGEWQDAYVLGVDEPLQSFTGVVIAVVVRNDDVETKLVVAPEGVTFTKEEIQKAVEFQEQYFRSEILTE